MHLSSKNFLGLISLGFLAWGTPLQAILPEALSQRLAESNPPKIIDVRATHDFEIAHIPGALNIPLEVLSRRKLPPFGPVVVVADGQGVVDAASAAAILREREGIQPEVLEGGFAAWESGQRSTTRRSGLSLETLPALTYQQLIATKESDIMLVDLRPPVAPAASLQANASRQTTTSQLTSASQAATASAASPDPIASLSRKLREARIATDPFAGTAAASASPVVSGTPLQAGKSAARATGTAAATTPVAAPVGVSSGVAPLLVLIDENDGRAQEVARMLVASGNRRFVILSGGVEAARLEGRSMVERSGGTISPGGGSTP